MIIVANKETFNTVTNILTGMVAYVYRKPSSHNLVEFSLVETTAGYVYILLTFLDSIRLFHLAEGIGENRTEFNI